MFIKTRWFLVYWYCVIAIVYRGVNEFLCSDIVYCADYVQCLTQNNSAREVHSCYNLCYNTLCVFLTFGIIINQKVKCIYIYIYIYIYYQVALYIVFFNIYCIFDLETTIIKTFSRTVLESNIVLETAIIQMAWKTLNM